MRGAALAALSLFMLVAAGEGSAAGPAPCPPAHTKIVARDRAVRVWSGAGVVVACDRRRGTAVALARPARPFHLNHSLSGFRLAGDIVGYLETSFGVDSGSTALVLVDVAARRRLRAVAVGSYVDAGLLSSEALASMLLTPRGSAAWTTTHSEHGVAGPSAVHLAARTGAVMLLDEGTGVDPSSLRLEGTTLSWSDGGVRRTHAMP